MRLSTHFRRLSAALALGALTLGLAACGGASDDSGKATIRLVNLSDSHSTFDLVAVGDDDDETTLAESVAADTASERSSIGSDELSFEVRRAGNETAVVTASWTLTEGAAHSAILYGSEGALKLVRLEEDEDTPDSGKARLRLYNTGTDAGSLDLYLTASDAALGDSAIVTTVAAGASSGFVTVTPGTYRLRLTASGDIADVRLDLPSVTVDDRGIVTVVLTGTSGGVLVNAALLAQDGGLTVYKNASARVRVAAGATANASVSATIAGTSVASTQLAPSVSSYKLVPAGSDLALALSVDGQAVSSPATLTLAAGGDYTLLVHGAAAAAQAVLLEDDNRLPSSTSQAKVRLVNALYGLSGGLTLNVDYAAVAIDVAAGEASDPAAIAAVSSAPLEVISPLATTPLFSIAEATLTAKNVYTVFMLGSTDSPYGLLRKDR